MKKIISIIVIIIGIIIAALLFDWGRKSPALNTGTDTQATATISDIVVFSPKENEVVRSPIVITGKAKGNWFFEAVFPVKLLDENGNVIVQTHAQATDDWMTTDFVNFSLSLPYDSASTSGRGVIEFKNDNPSGDPARDKYFYVPVMLK